MMDKECKYYCEQCGDCLECYGEDTCLFGGGNHGEQLRSILKEEKEKIKVRKGGGKGG